MLEYLYRYRYLTSELLGLLYETEQGRGRYQVRHQLTKLWKYGYVERFFRPADVALNPKNGQVYLSDSGNRRIQVYTAQGLFLRSLGAPKEGALRRASYGAGPRSCTSPRRR